MESIWKNRGTKLKINNTMVVDSTIVTMCMLHLSKPWLDFDFMPKTPLSIACICIWGDFTLKVIVVKIAMFSQSQCKYVHLEPFMVLYAIRSKVPYLLKTVASNITSLISKSKSFTTITNILSLIAIIDIVPTLLQKWSVIYWLKSLWDFKSEISSLHFIDFTLVKLFHYNITM